MILFKNKFIFEVVKKTLINIIAKIGKIATLVLLFLFVLSSCKNNDPSVLKIFVRSAGNQLLDGAQIVIIGDVNSDPATLPHVDTLVSNSSGFATFNLDDYFKSAGEDNSTAFFDLIVEKDGKDGSGYVRCRAHITTVETVYLSN